MLGIIGGINTQNGFAYCLNDPVNRSDHTGNAPQWDTFINGLLLVGIGVVAIAAVVGTAGAATPAVSLALAAVATAGTTCAVTGAMDISESITGGNPYKELVGENNYNNLQTGAVIASGVGVGFTDYLSSQQSMGSTNYMSRGSSTGGIQESDLIDQLALEEARLHPWEGKVISNVTLGDSRWPAYDGWLKMKQIVETSKGRVEIHYVWNYFYDVYDDFKIKQITK